jgi:hypothetical protein
MAVALLAAAPPAGAAETLGRSWPRTTTKDTGRTVVKGGRNPERPVLYDLKRRARVRSVAGDRAVWSVGRVAGFQRIQLQSL